MRDGQALTSAFFSGDCKFQTQVTASWMIQNMKMYRSSATSKTASAAGGSLIRYERHSRKLWEEVGIRPGVFLILLGASKRHMKYLTQQKMVIYRL